MDTGRSSDACGMAAAAGHAGLGSPLPCSFKGHKSLLQRCRKKTASPLETAYAREAKWSGAKAELRVIEGNRSWEGEEKNKKAACTWLLSTYNVLMQLR